MIGLLLLLLASQLAQATGEVPPREGDTVTLYTVQPGDTLERITRRFLGDRSVWPENQRLNPQVKDPNQLRIGARLRIITARTPSARSAEVVLVARRVEEKPSTLDWRPSRPGNVLHEKEGLRTGKDSSSALQFDDGTRLNLGEDSLVFLREATSTIAGRKKQSLEVMAGQADLRSRVPKASARSDIQILVGDAVLRPTADAQGEGAVRARRGSEGGADVMVFGGESQVEAAGVKVSVRSGMGTSVPKGGPPRPPERLLPRPILESPRPIQAVGYGNPVFVWRPVAGAVSYTVEICADPACDQIVSRATGLREPRYQIPQIAVNSYHWRAMGVTKGGLDGYPSASSEVEITSDELDLAAPVAVAQIQGLGRSEGDGTTRVAEGSRVLIEARDDASGVSELRYRWNGGAWQRNPTGAIAVPPGPSAQVLEFQAADFTGRESQIWSVRIQKWDKIPEPPALRGEPNKSWPAVIK